MPASLHAFDGVADRDLAVGQDVRVQTGTVDVRLDHAGARRALERRARLAQLDADESGRNVLTSGIDLNALVGERFRVGNVECVGVELCEPCTSLEGMTRPGVIKGYVHRAGLNADILTDGEIAVGDTVERL